MSKRNGANPMKILTAPIVMFLGVMAGMFLPVVTLIVVMMLSFGTLSLNRSETIAAVASISILMGMLALVVANRLKQKDAVQSGTSEKYSRNWKFQSGSLAIIYVFAVSFACGVVWSISICVSKFISPNMWENFIK